MDNTTHIFIADAHIKRPNNKAYIQLIRLVEGAIEAEVPSITFLGDTFDYWGEQFGQPYQRYEPLLEALAEYYAMGGKIHFVEGNRDYYMDYLRDQFPCDVVADSCVKEYDGVKVGVMHGHILDHGVYPPSWLKKMLYSQATRKLKNWLPEVVAWPIGQFIARMCWVLRKRGANLDVKASLGATIEELFYRPDLVLLGHLHRHEEFICKGTPVVVLPPWKNTLQYAEVKGKSVKIVTSE